MATNIGFDRGAPFVELGADDGELAFIGDRVAAVVKGSRAPSFTIDRSVNDGTTWEPVLGATPSEGGANLVDWESLSYGDTLYRAIAQTVEGATSATTITVPARSGAFWLSGGPGFALTCRLPLDPQLAITAGRQRSLKHWAGRTHPVPVVGEALNRAVSFSGEIGDLDGDTATSEQLTELAQVPEPVFLFRDPDGNRIYGSIGDITLTRTGSEWHEDGWNSIWGYALQMTETKRG